MGHTVPERGHLAESLSGPRRWTAVKHHERSPPRCAERPRGGSRAADSVQERGDTSATASISTN